MSLPVRFNKRAAAAEIFSLGLSDYLASGESVSNAVWSVASGPTLGTQTYNDTQTTCVVSGGTHGVSYAGTITITTDNGRTRVVPIVVSVND